jgi:kynurenine 3-monooxygenase
MPKKVVIVGAGPSGLLLAHYLLARQEKYQIEIYEQRLGPRTISISKSRTFPIALNERGMKALSKISGLETAVKAISREMRGSIIHQQNGKQKSISREKPLITLDRTELTKVLLDTLEQKYDRSRLNFYFQYSCTQVDLAAKTVSFESLTEGESKYSTVTYDLIIGADGARSVVRKSFLDLPLFELEQKYISNDYKSIFLPSQSDERAKIALESDTIHSWRMKDGTVILLLHQVDGSMNGVIHFPRKNNQIAALKNETEVLEFFQQNFPELGQMMSRSQAAEFLERPISSTLTICCSYYHYADSVLLIGDAAHAVSPSLGQGCNSALEDVFIFNQLLDEYADDLKQALEQFTNRRLADAHAVVELSNNTLPFSNSLYIQFLIREYFAKILNRLFPKRFLPPLFEALYQSSITYTEILHAYQNWCSKVKRINVAQK